MLDDLRVQALIGEQGWTAYGLLQALLDECFKQSSGTLQADLGVIARAIRVDLDTLRLTVERCVELGILTRVVTTHKSLPTVVTLYHEGTLADHKAHVERKQMFKSRASSAAQARNKKCLTTATSRAQAVSVQLLGEEEKVKEEEEVREVKEGGVEGGNLPTLVVTPKKPKPQKLEFAAGVFLTEQEFNQLCEKYGGERYVRTRLESMSDYQAANGKRYRDHAAAFRQWERRGREASANAPAADQIGLEFGGKRSKQVLSIRESLRAIDSARAPKPAIEIEVLP
jgi:hypothetical protein